MVEVGGSPILAYQVEQFKQAGITQIVFACSYKKEILKEFWGDGSKFGLEISYSEEDQPLGRGGGIKQAMGLLSGDWDYVVATNGDNLWRYNLKPLFNFHIKHQGMATIVGAPFISPYGIIEANDLNQVTKYREKPPLPYWVNAGTYVFSKEVMGLLPDIGDQEVETFPKLKPDQFYLYKTDEYWRGIDNMKDLSEAEKDLEKFFGDFTFSWA